MCNTSDTDMSRAIRENSEKQRRRKEGTTWNGAIDARDLPGHGIDKTSNTLHHVQMCNTKVSCRIVLQGFGDGKEGWFTERQMDFIAELFRPNKSKANSAH